MASISVDFGAIRTKMAVFDQSLCKPVVCAVIPSVFYVHRVGDDVRFGEAALEGIKADALGIVRGLKSSKLGGGAFHQNGKMRNPVDLATALFREIRQRCHDLELPTNVAAECCLTVPTHFELQKRDCLREAAVRAGFQTVTQIEDPVAAVRHWLRHDRTDLPDLVVCDIGRTLNITLLRRHGSQWRPNPGVPHSPFDLPDHFDGSPRTTASTDASLPPPDSLTSQDSLSVTVLRELRHTAIAMKQAGVADAPLLLVGGGSRFNKLSDVIEANGWPGRVCIWDESEFATVLGAVQPIVTTEPQDVTPVVVASGQITGRADNANERKVSTIQRLKVTREVSVPEMSASHPPEQPLAESIVQEMTAWGAQQFNGDPRVNAANVNQMLFAGKFPDNSPLAAILRVELLAKKLAASHIEYSVCVLTDSDGRLMRYTIPLDVDPSWEDAPDEFRKDFIRGRNPITCVLYSKPSQ